MDEIEMFFVFLIVQNWHSSFLSKFSSIYIFYITSGVVLISNILAIYPFKALSVYAWCFFFLIQTDLEVHLHIIKLPINNTWNEYFLYLTLFKHHTG